MNKEIKVDGDHLVYKEILEALDNPDPLDPQVHRDLRDETGQMDRRVPQENQADPEKMGSLDNPAQMEKTENQGPLDQTEERERLAQQDLSDPKENEELRAPPGPWVTLVHQEYKEQREKKAHQEQTDEMDHRDFLDRGVRKGPKGLPELPEKVVSMVELERMVLMDVQVLREKAAHPEIQVRLEAPDRPAHPDLREIPDHRVYRERKEDVGRMAFQEKLENQVLRVTKDLKDRREKWDLLVKKETRVGLEHREILDPRVTRVNQVPQEEMVLTGLQGRGVLLVRWVA